LEKRVVKTKTKKLKYRFAEMPRDYAGLIAMLPPRTIHDTIEFDNICEIVFEMCGHALTPDQEDYLEILSNLVCDWEEKHPPKWPTKEPTGLDSLRHLLEENKMTAADLARLLGVHRSLGAMILRGERQLTVGHIKTLAKRFCVSGELFL
jgi:HTH-type transcriptional regulator / antitoxin HigA